VRKSSRTLGVPKFVSEAEVVAYSPTSQISLIYDDSKASWNSLRGTKMKLNVFSVIFGLVATFLWLTGL